MQWEIPEAKSKNYMPNKDQQYKFESLLIGGVEKESRPLSANDLIRLFDSTDWGVVQTIGMKFSYNSIPVVSLLKVCILPFIIEIPTERELIRTLEERSLLQTICGFAEGDPLPTRATLWHFRRNLRINSLYRDILTRILVALAVASLRMELTLPFMKRQQVAAISALPKVRLEKLPKFYPKVEVVVPKDQRKEDNPSIDSSSKSLIKEGITKGLDLPIDVVIVDNEGNDIALRFDHPIWLAKSIIKSDSVNSLGSAKNIPYSACGIVVTKTINNKIHVLLGKRKQGYGAGLFALPGGKQKPMETLKVCAERELREETGLSLIESKPISIRKNVYANKPWVLSIGVLAIKYKGALANREPHLIEKWEWHDTSNLPYDLFDPTRLVLDHYLKSKFPNLDWEDIEPINEKEYIRKKQIGIFPE